MGANDDKMISGLRDVVRQLKEGQRVVCDFKQLPNTESSDLNALKEELEKLCCQYNENYKFILDIAKGNLNITPPARNSFANPYKQLQSDLLHLTWQIQQISEGDYDQKVFFSGDFSDAINKMIESLKEKRRINELNEAYLKELKELDAMKDRFFYIIAHDLKNPFSGLLMLSDVLLTNVREKKYEDLEEYATLVKDFSDNGYKLLINLLEWARSQTNSLKINIEPLSLAAIVEESKSTISPRALQKKIDIVCSCSHDYLILADINMINAVMRNLLSNAVKFTNANGTVQISGEESDNMVTVHIADNGIGISPENLKNLFRIDLNSSTKGTDNEEGTGLGLILCKDFIEKMNGRFSVESELGKGSIFSFSLPKA